MHTSDLLPGWHGWGETLGNRRGWRVRAEMQAAAEAQHSQEGSPSLGEGAFACVRASNVVQRTCVCVRVMSQQLVGQSPPQNPICSSFSTCVSNLPHPSVVRGRARYTFRYRAVRIRSSWC
jgi:hypothetical protein